MWTVSASTIPNNKSFCIFIELSSFVVSFICVVYCCKFCPFLVIQKCFFFFKIEVVEGCVGNKILEMEVLRWLKQFH